jgi:hypothetical protein
MYAAPCTTPRVKIALKRKQTVIVWRLLRCNNLKRQCAITFVKDDGSFGFHFLSKTLYNFGTHLRSWAPLCCRSTIASLGWGGGRGGKNWEGEGCCCKVLTAYDCDGSLLDDVYAQPPTAGAARSCASHTASFQRWKEVTGECCLRWRGCGGHMSNAAFKRTETGMCSLLTHSDAP